MDGLVTMLMRLMAKILLNIPKNNNFLVQEKLFDCIYGKARHFRLVTLYNGDIFLLWTLRTKDKTEIASNVKRSNSGIL